MGEEENLPADYEDKVSERAKQIANNFSNKSEDQDGPSMLADFQYIWQDISESMDDTDLSAKQRAFLAAYSVFGTVTHSANIANCSHRTVNTYWVEDEEFMRYYELADRAHTEYLEMEAQRRAVEGVTEPVYHNGEKVGERTKYSDNLLMFLLKGKKPVQYRDNATVEISGGDNTEINVQFGVPEMDREIENREVIEVDDEDGEQ